MLGNFLSALAKRLENPKHPLLGPSLRGLQLFGLWQCGTKFVTKCSNFSQAFFFVFIITSFAGSLQHDNSFKKTMEDLSLNIQLTLIFIKTLSFVLWQNTLRELVQDISDWEHSEIRKRNAETLEIMKNYTKYTRVLTYFFWSASFITMMLLIASPFLSLLYKEHRKAIFSGEKNFVHMSNSWFPFDEYKFPGLLIALVVHSIMGVYATGCLATYDSTALAIMVFLRGQLEVLRVKCQRILVEKQTRDDDAYKIVKECHKHHEFLIKCYGNFNSMFSPVMFLYVLVSSAVLCGTIVRITSEPVSVPDKIAVSTVSMFCLFQMFFHFWHSNEVIVASEKVDRGVYESDWWKSDVRQRRLILLLAGKLNYKFELTAGPFTVLSLTTFVQIIKGSYSLYTILSQI